MIPTQNDKPMTVDKASFAQAVDRVSTIASAESRAVKLSATSGRLNLSANSPDRGQASEDIDVDYGATDIEIGFNARYLLDIATQLSGETAEFVFADAGSPQRWSKTVTTRRCSTSSCRCGFRLNRPIRTQGQG